MRFLRTNSVEIEVEGVRYDSLKDLKLAIENTDYIGDPVMENNLAWVPGRSGPVDYTDKVFGEQYYQYRPIKIIFGGMCQAECWDERISYYRKLFHGKNVKVKFKTMSDYYFTGRASIEDFSRVRPLGKFSFCINYADPYMYKNEETIHEIIATSSGVTLDLYNDELSVIPVFTTEGSISVEFNGKTIDFANAGEHDSADIVLKEGSNPITIKGNNINTRIVYREGRL